MWSAVQTDTLLSVIYKVKPSHEYVGMFKEVLLPLAFPVSVPTVATDLPSCLSVFALIVPLEDEIPFQVISCPLI